jgi:O-acetyl-ADP-ribose deacetylase (regulator of RNase III)
MIHQVSGDILLSQAQVIAHGVAANDPMKQGLALQLREKYPALHKDFHHWCNTQHPKPGEAWMWGAPGGVRIVNLLTQDGGYGHGARPELATIKNVRESLRALAHMAETERFTSIALPRLATGVGELQWKDVWPVIQERLGSLGIPIFVYAEYHGGQKANEPLG